MGLSNWTNNNIHNRPNILELATNPSFPNQYELVNVVHVASQTTESYQLPELPNLPSTFLLYYASLSLGVSHPAFTNGFFAHTLLSLPLSLLSLSSSPSFSLNLRRLISSQSNGLDLFSSRNLDRPSLAADDIHDLLPHYGFPKGLLPNNVKSYTLSDDGDITVDLISPCYVSFSDQIVFYGQKIAGKLSYGSVKDVRGIQAKEAFLWLPITAIESDPSSATVVFSVGFISKTLPASMFDNVPSCSRKLFNLQDS